MEGQGRVPFPHLFSGSQEVRGPGSWQLTSWVQESLWTISKARVSVSNLLRDLPWASIAPSQVCCPEARPRRGG